MRITRLEVFGFKSFLEKLVLPLEAGITGVVGPNGCGKSNIVDALRWVLGETRASNLRGGTLEDVIFNGTDKLRPLGLAEVTITLRASESDFFADLSKSFSHIKLSSKPTEGEVGPGQEIPDSGSAEEQKEQPAEVQPQGELSQNTEGEQPSGRPQLRVIDGALSNNPEEVSASVEVDVDAANAASEALNAAGSEQADPLLKGTEAASQPGVSEEIMDEEEGQAAQIFLTRFAWLKQLQEVQVTRRLYRSGESEFFINRVPCRLRDLKDLFRVVGLGTRAYTIVAQGEVSRIVTARPEERRLIIEECAGVSGFRDKIASASRRLEETSVNISRIDDVVKEVTRQVNSLRIQASRAKNREQLKARVAELEKAIFVDGLGCFSEQRAQRENEANKTKMELEAAEAAFQRIDAEEHEARGALMSIDVESDSLRSKMDSIREELDNRERSRAQFNSKLVEIRAHITARANEAESLESRRSVLFERIQEVSREVEVLMTRDGELLNELGVLGGGSEDALRIATEKLQQLRNDLRTKELELRAVRDEMVSLESRKQAMEEQLAAASPINQLKEALGSRLEQGEDRGAIEALSGQLGEGIKLFADALSVPSEYAKAAQALLSEKAAFILAKDPFAIARNYRANTGSSNEIPALGVFRENQEDSACAPALIVRENVPFIKALDAISFKSEAALAARRVFEGVFFCDSLDSALSYFEQSAGQPGSCTLVTLDGEVVTDHSFFSMKHEGGLIQLKRELENLSRSVEEITVRYNSSAATRDALAQAVAEAEVRHSVALTENQRCQQQARELANQQGSVKGRLQAAQRTLEQMEQDAKTASELIAAATARIEEYHFEEDEALSALRDLETDEELALKEELEKIRTEYHALDGVRREHREKLSEASLNSDSARRAVDTGREKVSASALELQKLDLEFQNMRERFSLEYGAEAMQQMLSGLQGDTKPAPLTGEQRAEYFEESQRVRARIIREGEVDSSSIQRFEEEQARLDNLSTQRADLESAAVTLRKTIERLTATSERRFLTTLKIVNQNFADLVPRLFGGGKGNLELLDPSNPLESGVEIMIRPPGKRLKTIELMSGGEKALCAIALIFAMFMHRPSPLCVLDEVDAPLDEANLMRYLNMVKEMTSRTQFIMITHNKQSMNMSDNLVGVTMQTPGASRMISVSLQEAVSMQGNVAKVA